MGTVSEDWHAKKEKQDAMVAEFLIGVDSEDVLRARLYGLGLRGDYLSLEVRQAAARKHALGLKDHKVYKASGVKMVKTTRAQREALFKVFQRQFPNWVSPSKRRAHSTNEIVKVPTIQYRMFRAKVQPFFGDTCIMIPYAGMWLGIEQDGYTHS